jgi:hypothetical protein
MSKPKPKTDIPVETEEEKNKKLIEKINGFLERYMGTNL